MRKKKVCPDCSVEKSLEDFPRDRSRGDGRAAYCKSCKGLRAKKYRQDHPEKHQVEDRKAKYLSFYDITIDDYDKMFLQQAGKCAICGTSAPEGMFNNFSVDHDHATGRIRGLLCSECNFGLGNFRDDTKLLENAIQYLTL